MDGNPQGRSAGSQAAKPQATGSQAAPNASPQLAPGTLVAGGRYSVAAAMRVGVFAAQYRARDEQTGDEVTLHVLRSELASSPELATAVVDSARAAAAVRDPALVAVRDAGASEGSVYVVTDHVPGHTLAEVLARRRATNNGAFAARSALNLGVRIFAGLAGAQPHGALTPSGVLISGAADIRVTDLGFAPAVPLARQAGLWPEDASIAPEVSSGAPPSPASDVYAGGALLYLVAVGRPAQPGCPRPSEASPGLSPEVDEIVARCMLPDPEARFGSPLAVMHALAAIAEEAEAPSQPAHGQASGQSLSQSLAAPGGAPATSDALADALADAEERWLVTKDKLDYGPFSTAEFVAEIEGDRVLPGHVVIDKHSGERHPVEAHPVFGDVADRARQVRDDRRRASAEETHTVKERRRGAALYGMIAAGVVALGGGGYLLISDLTDSDDGGDAEIAGLGEEAELTITPAEATSEPRGSSGRRGGGTRGGGGGSAMGYDDTRTFDMGEGGGGSERLSNAQLNQTIQGHTGALAGCLTRTGSQRADIEFIVRGDGNVSGVRVNGQTGGALTSCISGVMQRMQFPTFDGDRTRGNFDISL